MSMRPPGIIIPNNSPVATFGLVTTTGAAAGDLVHTLAPGLPKSGKYPGTITPELTYL